MISKRKIEVTYADTDMMGIVYHGSYIVWFELGRTKFLNDLGCSMKDFDDVGIMFPITKLNVQYKSPTRYLDDVEIETTVLRISKVSTTYLHKVFAAGVLSVIGEVTLAHVDNKSFEIVNLKKRSEKIFNKYSEVVVNG